MSIFTQSDPQTDDKPPRKLALVLSGGGPRGALQVGALRALMEEEIVPDFIVGTSIGAINGAYLARYGYSIETLDTIIDVWDSSARGDFSPGDFTRALLRNLLPGIHNNGYLDQARAFYAKHGIPPDLTFADLPGPRLYIITTDVSHHKITIFGENPDDLVLDSMLASAAIPPWLPPIKIGKSLYLDGGAVSNVPIEPAMRLGATEMIVLDLFNPPPPPENETISGVKALMDRVITTMEARHLELELELAKLRGVPIHRWPLRYHISPPLWDLSHTHNLIHAGYEQGKDYLAEMKRGESIAAPPATGLPASTSGRWDLLKRQLQTLFIHHRRS
jgi:NTE family protein